MTIQGAEGFTAKLADCLIEAETDAEIVSAVNSAFESNIATDDFTNAMSSIRITRIDTADFYDITTKNNIDLVKWVTQAAEKVGDMFKEHVGQSLMNSSLQ